MNEDIQSIGADLKETVLSTGIWDHIDELRKRLFKALISLVLGTLVSFIIARKPI